ncbi:MAG: SET domain-containing protein [Myxococcales bacterium]|nr:SET domain-containing protein [Myxococcales bacterium]
MRRSSRGLGEAQMIHPFTRILPIDEEIGDGVFATQRIPRGTIVWTQDGLDRVMLEEHLEDMSPALRAQVERYAHLDAARNRILCWDAGRYINHHCDPTLRGVGPWFQVARRDIEAGEELTCDYAECNVDPALECRCGAPGCRRLVHGRDLLELATGWDREAAALAVAARAVEQPLWPFLLDPAAAEAWIAGRVPLPSFVELCAFRRTA